MTPACCWEREPFGPLCRPPNRVLAWWGRPVLGQSGGSRRPLSITARISSVQQQPHHGGAHGQGRAQHSESRGAAGDQGIWAPGWVSWCHQGGKAFLACLAPGGDVFLLRGYILVLWST